MENNNIDIEEIIKEVKARIEHDNIVMEIREAIIQNGYIEDALPFTDIPMSPAVSVDSAQGYNFDELMRNIGEINRNYYIEPYRILKSNRPVFGKAIIFIKKIIRKSIKFYIEPLAHDQSEFNASVVRCLNQLSFYVQEEGEKEKVSERNYIKNLEQELNWLRRENDVLIKENKWLKKNSKET